MARSVKELFVLWFKLILPLVHKDNTEFITTLRHTWAVYKNEMPRSIDHLEEVAPQVQGIITQVIAFLLFLQWKPTAFNVWEDPPGNIWKLQVGSPFPIMVLIRRMIKKYHQKMDRGN